MNLELLKYGFVKFIWGNVSVIDWDSGLFVIKLSGVSYDVMKLSDMVVVDLDGNVVEGEMRLFLDIVIYVVLYKYYFEIGGIVYIYFIWVIIWV